MCRAFIEKSIDLIARVLVPLNADAATAEQLKHFITSSMRIGEWMGLLLVSFLNQSLAERVLLFRSSFLVPLSIAQSTCPVPALYTPHFINLPSLFSNVCHFLYSFQVALICTALPTDCPRAATQCLWCAVQIRSSHTPATWPLRTTLASTTKSSTFKQDTSQETAHAHCFRP